MNFVLNHAPGTGSTIYFRNHIYFNMIREIFGFTVRHMLVSLFSSVKFIHVILLIMMVVVVPVMVGGGDDDGDDDDDDDDDDGAINNKYILYLFIYLNFTDCTHVHFEHYCYDSGPVVSYNESNCPIFLLLFLFTRCCSPRPLDPMDMVAGMFPELWRGVADQGALLC